MRWQLSQLYWHRGETRIRELFVAMTERLSLVVITIDGENPYEIFESLNSTGLPLEESDLVRNYLFMQVPIAEQEEFNADHWEDFEQIFETIEDYPAITPTAFYRNFLMRLGEYSKAKQTFVDFKKQNRQRGLTPVEQVAELKRFAGFEQSLRRPKTCQDPGIRSALGQLAMLDITTAHPLLLNLFERHKNGQLDYDEFLGCLHDLASFALRRSICGESTRNYGRWFCEAITAIREDPKSDLRGYLIRRGWPDDNAFAHRLSEFPIYRRESKKCRLVLETLEQSYGHKEKVDPATLTIEHVMPQTLSGKSGNAWKAMLGDDWKKVHERLLHSIGNLTLSGYNQDLGNKAYEAKRAELLRSNLVLNKHFENVEEWAEPAIVARGEKMAEQIVELWPRPDGGAYTPLVEVSTSRVTTLEKRQAKIEYWSEFLGVVKRQGNVTRLPKATQLGRVAFPIGRRGFKVLAYMEINKNRIGVFLSCRGKNAKRNFACLKEQRREIEDSIGEVLQWDELPNNVSSHIVLRRPRTNPLDRAEWPSQHAWLAERLTRFVTVFKPICDDLAETLADGTRFTVRERFWSALLERAAPKTSLHGNISPGRYSWIGTSAGTAGFQYVYAITKTATKVELYIDQGKGAKKRNKQLFDSLLGQKAEIESAFGGSLDWERLDTKQACRIAYNMQAGGYRSPESDWPSIQDEMIEAMIRLERSVGTRIAELQP